MAFKENILYITDNCYLDPDGSTVYCTKTGKSRRLGKNAFYVLQYLLENPNIALAMKDIDAYLSRVIRGRQTVEQKLEAENELGKKAAMDQYGFLKRQIKRIRELLVDLTGSSDIGSLFEMSSSPEETVRYRQPEGLSLLKPRISPQYYNPTRRIELDDPNLPRLLSQYTAERTQLENKIINRFMSREETVVFLTGEAGMGKSELAISIGRKLGDYGVARIIYDGSWQDTIMKLYPQINGIDHKTVFEKKFAALCYSYAEGFIIVDNFYDPQKSFRDMVSDEVFTRLLSSNVNLIFVTRYQDTGIYTSYAVPPLPIKEQISVMRGNGITQCSDRQLEKLCKLVGGNTLLCDLIGKLLRNPYNPMSYDEISELLTTNKLSRSTLKVVSGKDRHNEESTVYQHLKKLCSNVTVSVEEKNVLSAASLLPLEGMDLNAFVTFCRCDENTLSSLDSKGLISTYEYDCSRKRTRKVFLHALYTICYRDPSSGSDICNADVSGFLDALCENFNNGDLSDQDLNRSICSTLMNAYRNESDRNMRASLGLFLASYLGLSGRYTEAYEIELECIEDSDLLDAELLGKLYKDIGISAGRLDKNEDSIRYLEKAMDLLSGSDNIVAGLQVINTLAYTYGKSGDYLRQKDIIRKALEETDYSEHMENHARLLNNLADSEYHLSEYDDAETHVKEAIVEYGTVEKAAIWTIQAKRLYGNILYSKGRKEEAIKLMRRTLEEATDLNSPNKLEEDHLELIRLSAFLGDMLDPDDAKEFYVDAVKRSMKNSMANERLRFLQDRGHRYLVFVSEGGTLFRFEVTEDYDYEPFDPSSVDQIRTITCSLREQSVDEDT